MSDTRNPSPTQPAGEHLSAAPGGLLMRRLDGELSAKERARVDAHVAACPACAHELRVYDALFLGVARLPKAVPAPGLSARINRAVLLDRRARRRFKLFEAVGSVYAASVVTVLIAVGLSPWREDLVAGGRTIVGSAVSGVVNAFLVAFDRLMWLFDGAVKLRENAHALSTSLAPLGRTLELVAAQPELRAGLSVALVLTTALWWFIQHRRVEGPGRMHDVSAFL